MKNGELGIRRVGQPDGKSRDIQARSFVFAVGVVHLYREVVRQGTGERALAMQLLRSGTAVGANLEEASAGHSRPDFIAKCVIALKEARETHYWLRLLAACAVLPAHRVAPLVTEASELVSILTAIVKNARTNRERPDEDERGGVRK
jgi:four helix bundle protein